MEITTPTRKKKRGRPRGSSKKNKRINVDDLDPLTKWFFDKTKGIIHHLKEHKKAKYFVSVVHIGNMGDIVKQNVDLETINNQLLSGHYFNDGTLLTASYKQWKSDIRTVFENFAMVYGPESAKKSSNGESFDETKKQRLLMELDDIDGSDKYDEIYHNCSVMLTYFHNKLHDMQKQFKKLMKKQDDWNVNKNGKYSQYTKNKEEILNMIYDELDDNKDRLIQKMEFILICPKRRLQLANGKYNKKDMDLLPYTFLCKLARKGVTKSGRKGINNTTLSNQKRIFWNQYQHSQNSLKHGNAIKKKNRLRGNYGHNNNHNTNQHVIGDDDDDDLYGNEDGDINMDIN